MNATNVTLAPGGNVTVAFGVDTAGRNGSYAHGVLAGNASNLTTVTVAVENRAANGTLPVTVRFDGTVVASRSPTLATDERTTFAESVPTAGLNGSYRIEVSTANDTNATTVSVTLERTDEPGPGPGDEPDTDPVGPPDVTGDGEVPTDPDGDGRYEDVDGSGELDILDVAALLDALDSPAVTGHAAQFDFDGDGATDVIDVATLLDRI